MEETRFDALTRILSLGHSRRELARRLGGVALGGALTRLGGAETEAKKHRKKPLALNFFGCVNVGGKCRGNNANCCSGICQGKKPKKGKKDTSQCIAHNAGSCQAGQDTCVTGSVPCGTGGVCARTTGNASFCTTAAICTACNKDTDCQAVLAPGAACITCLASCLQTLTACALPAA